MRRLGGIPSDTYDCFILTQTVHVINDMPAVIREAVRILKPGGVLLGTWPCASRVCLEYGPNGDFWRVTEAGVRELFRGVVPASHQAIQTFGNPLATLAFTAGLACQDVSAEEFESYDPFNPTLVGIRAVKPGAVLRVRPPAPAPTAVVLMYHRVTRANHDLHGLAVTPDEFRDQMDLLRREYQPVPLAQLASAVREGWLPERGVAVTFDDGYLDNLVEASPILLDAGIPATFFFTDHALTGQMPFWWDVLEAAFFGGHDVPERLTLEFEGQPRVWLTGTPQARADAHWALYHLLRTAPDPRRSALVTRIAEWSGCSWDQLPRVMSGPQLIDLSRRPGHSIGGHGSAHLSYSSHPDEVVRADVVDNRSRLEAVIGRLVTSFAYPYGDHHDSAVEIVEDAGYRGAVTCVDQAIRLDAHPLRLPRIAVTPRDEVPLAERLRQTFRPNSQLQPR
jgi:peptidoglycan/xylan/chitin deacetylase (PgdA/CDA1 family)